MYRINWVVIFNSLILIGADPSHLNLPTYILLSKMLKRFLRKFISLSKVLYKFYKMLYLSQGYTLYLLSLTYPNPFKYMYQQNRWNYLLKGKHEFVLHCLTYFLLKEMRTRKTYFENDALMPGSINTYTYIVNFPFCSGSVCMSFWPLAHTDHMFTADRKLSVSQASPFSCYQSVYFRLLICSVISSLSGS